MITRSPTRSSTSSRRHGCIKVSWRGPLSGLGLLTLASVGTIDAAIAQRRLVPLEQLVTSADLPAKVLQPGERAEVMAELTITPDGFVGRCRPVYSTNFRLDKVTCALITARARYAPAYDKSGGKRSSWDRIDVYWGASPAPTLVGLNDFGGAEPAVPEETWLGLPSLTRRSTSKGSALVRYEIQPSGKVGRCVVVQVLGDPLMADHVCRSLQGWAKFKPPVDEKGEPYATVGQLKFDWQGTTSLPRHLQR